MKKWSHTGRDRRWKYSVTCELLLILAVLITLAGCQSISAAPSTQPTTPNSAVSFGSVPLGESQSLTATATNTAKTAVTVTSVASTSSQLSLAQAFLTPRSVTHPVLPVTITGGQNVTLSINFARSATVTTAASFAFTSAVSNAPATVSLSVTGTGFSVNGFNHPVTLRAGESLKFNVTFTPQFAGSASGNLVITSTAPNGTVNIPLAGMGTATSVIGTQTGDLVVSPTSLALGTVPVGTSTNLPASLSATGASVTVYSANLSSSEFSLSGISFPTTIAAGHSLPFNVTFKPQATGTASGTLSFVSSGSNSPAVLALGGTGGPALVASVTVAASSATILFGKTHQFSATAKDARGNVITGVDFAWNSDAPSVATVDPDGLATGVNQGTTHISAAVSGISGIATVMVDTAASPNATLFGLHVRSLSTPWPTIGFGGIRLWDTATRWAQIERSPGVYDFSTLDSVLARAYSHGVTTVIYTFGQVPRWASSNPTDSGCDYASWAGTGGCDLPTDINLDGSGTNQRWINFVTALAQHVNDPTYLQTHAHIQYWEPWNEFFRDSVVTTFPWNTISVRATYAQMVRMTEDLRCIVTGTGSVNGIPCTAPPLDTTAKIVSPSDYGAPCCGLENTFQNFLYCNGTGKNAPLPGSHCTTGSRGSAVVDIINSHFYTGIHQPETLAANVKQYKALLSPTDLAKPLWSDEGGWAKDSLVSDPDIQASWVARYYLVGWSSGLAQMYWYAYDSTEFGTLWTLSGGLNKAGVAYGQTYNWIADSTLTTPCSARGTVWTCGFTLSNGDAAEAIWDTSQTCANGNCTTSNQSVSSAWTNYQDLAGTNNIIANRTVPVGIKPIVLTPSAP